LPNTNTALYVGSTTGNVEPNPVSGDIYVGYITVDRVRVNKYHLYFFWNNINGISYHKKIVTTDHSYDEGGTLTDPNSILQNPSLSMPYLTYDDNRKIYLRKFTANTTTYTSHIGPVEIVPASDEGGIYPYKDRESRKSQVTSAGDIVWEAGNYIPYNEDPIEPYSIRTLALSPDPGDPIPPRSAIFYQKRNPDGTYGQAISWSGAVNYYNPTVASYNGNITVMWDDGENTYRVSSPNLNSVNVISGINPNLIPEQMRYVYLKSSSLLYDVKVEPKDVIVEPPLDSCQIYVCEDDPIEINRLTISRSVIVNSTEDSTTFEITISEPKLYSSSGKIGRIPFESIPEAVEIQGVDNVADYLKTKPFKLTKDSLRIGGIIIVRNPAGLILPGTAYGKIKFEVVDAATGNVLMRIGNEMGIEHSSKIKFNSKSYVKNFEGRIVYIRPKFIGMPKRNLTGTVITNYYFNELTPPASKPGIAENISETKQLPIQYSLHQNRPNPFNPITQISYALPAAGHTTLKIYDVLGREVAVLVNEYKEAGVYEVVWDASAQPSGVYFYKLQSGNFVAVKKMLLVR